MLQKGTSLKKGTRKLSQMKRVKDRGKTENDKNKVFNMKSKLGKKGKTKLVRQLPNDKDSVTDTCEPLIKYIEFEKIYMLGTVESISIRKKN